MTHETHTTHNTRHTCVLHNTQYTPQRNVTLICEEVVVCNVEYAQLGECSEVARQTFDRVVGHVELGEARREPVDDPQPVVGQVQLVEALERAARRRVRTAQLTVVVRGRRRRGVVVLGPRGERGDEVVREVERHEAREVGQVGGDRADEVAREVERREQRQSVDERCGQARQRVVANVQPDAVALRLLLLCSSV